jgi:hypothetical protein
MSIQSHGSGELLLGHPEVTPSRALLLTTMHNKNNRREASESRYSRDESTRAQLACDIFQYLPSVALRTTGDCLAKR